MIRVDASTVQIARDPHTRKVGGRHGHKWCHLWCDEGEEEALHAMAASIGMKREWFQDKPGFPHYDLVPPRRAKALKQGAVETDLKTWLKERRAKTVSVHWVCGCLLGHNPFDWDEPDECPAEFETEEDPWDWEERLCSVKCPDCGSTLCQRDGHATPIV